MPKLCSRSYVAFRGAMETYLVWCEQQRPEAVQVLYTVEHHACVVGPEGFVRCSYQTTALRHCCTFSGKAAL